MSLEEVDLDDLAFDARSKCGAWAVKLGAPYPCVGTLAEYPDVQRVPESAFMYDKDAPPLDAPQPGAREDGGGGGGAACPLTGALGAECPLGFVGGNGGKSSAATGVGEGASECPFPFSFLHDPA